tara:strand:- start:56512 stop:59502 length:2991 start_codon:yes stop_codon:yes gene_type:complete
MCQRSKPEIRYGLSIVALICCLLISVKTFVYCYQDVAQASQLFTQLQTTLNTPQIQNWWVTTFTTINPWLDTIVLCWCVGFIIQGIRYGYDIRLTQKLKSQSVSHLPQQWDKRLQSLVQKLGVTKSVAFMHSTKINVPCVIGHFKPVILLPLGILVQLPQAHIEAIVLHELAHVKRHDYLTNILLCLIKVLFFFNPSVLAIGKKISIERENICDDIAVKACGDPLTFANSLSQFADVTPVSQSAMAASKDKYLLLERVKRLFPNNGKLATSTERLIALICAGLLGLTLNVNAKNQPSPAEFEATPTQLETVNFPVKQDATSSDIAEEIPSSEAEIAKPTKGVNNEMASNDETAIASESVNNLNIAVKASQKPSLDNVPLIKSTPNIAAKPLQKTLEDNQSLPLLAQNNATETSSAAGHYLALKNEKVKKAKKAVKQIKETIQTPQQPTGRVYASTDKFSSFSLESPNALDNIDQIIFAPISTSDTEFSQGARRWRNVVSQYFSEVQNQKPRVITLNRKDRTEADFTGLNSSLIAQIRIKDVNLLGPGQETSRPLILRNSTDSSIMATKWRDSRRSTPGPSDNNISSPIQKLESTESLHSRADLKKVKFVLEVIAEVVFVDAINYEYVGSGLKTIWLDSANVEPDLLSLVRDRESPTNSRTQTERNADIIKNAWDILLSHLQNDVYQVAAAIKNQELELTLATAMENSPTKNSDLNRNLASQYFRVENSEFEDFIISSPDSLNDFKNLTYSPIGSEQVKLNSKHLEWKQHTTLALSNLAKQAGQTYILTKDLAKNVPSSPEQINPSNNQNLVVQIDVKSMERYSRNANRIYRNAPEYTSGGSNYNRGAVATGTGLSPSKDDVGGATVRKGTLAMPSAFDTKQYLRGEFDITLLDPKTHLVLGHAIAMTAVSPNHSAFKKLAEQFNAQNQSASYEDMLLLALFEQVKTQLHNELSRVQQGKVSVKPIQLTTEQVKNITDAPLISQHKRSDFTVANLAY